MNRTKDIAIVVLLSAVVYLMATRTSTVGSDVKWGELEIDDPEHVADVLESLMQAINNETNQRRDLEERLEQLHSELNDLRQNFDARVEAAVANYVADSDTQQLEDQAGQTSADRLAAAGLTAQQIEIIRLRESEARMQWVELDDKARREGWVNTPRYYSELNAMNGAMGAVRGDLGDEVYDRYLFASGRANRVAVGMVFETSSAAQGGIQVGDVIWGYGGERVFSTEQLNNLRSAGAKSQPVIVDIVRNGQLMQVTIPRGPMGIQARPETVDPGAMRGG